MVRVRVGVSYNLTKIITLSYLSLMKGEIASQLASPADRV